jgi:hypothetical protein
MRSDEHSAELSFSLRRLADPDLAPLFWHPERRGTYSSWWGHVPFAHWLTCAVEPRVLVELGTYRGVSYTAFCEAVRREGLKTRCFAVDTWQGDPHTAFYDDSIYEEFRAFHDPRYAAFSTLLRCSFDDALPRFADGSVDLLHIDGFHTYDAVRHDFESWLPKLSRRAVVLFHDTCIHQADFGVWRLWRELTAQYPHFAFEHSCGLGVLAVGGAVPQALAELCAVAETKEGAELRERVALVAGSWMAEQDATTAALDAEQRLAQAEARAADAARRLQEIYDSSFYRALAPARWLARRYPRLVRAVRALRSKPQ